ncbi:MAG: alanine racemase, partial [Bacteroidetes bacterium]|nr:alanine racemase [Bacteroidota bacterium]
KDEIFNTPQFHIQSVFSHLVASEDPQMEAFTFKQFDAYNEMVAEISQACTYPFLKHLGNSAAIVRYKPMQLDMVRLGIGLYGIEANPLLQKQLLNVTTLKTSISQIHHAKAGETVGYNRAGVLNKDSVIATVRIGYADGYFRHLGNGNGKMLVNGKLAPVIGNVCMDMLMLDITGINAEEEDTVIVFGEDLPVSQIAQWAGTIPYEILCGVSQRVRRVYYEE